MRFLIIIRRFNGDVLLTSPLIQKLKENYPQCQIDILVNDNTAAVAGLLKNIDNIIIFDQSFRQKRGMKRVLTRLNTEFNILKRIIKKYDLSINLTATDSSNIYAIISGKKSIGVGEKGAIRKSWWKQRFLGKCFEEDFSENIVLHNIYPLEYLKIKKNDLYVSLNIDDKDIENSKNIIDDEKKFVIIHSSSQFFYKTWPIEKTIELAEKIIEKGFQVVFTGGKGEVDLFNSNRIGKEIGINLIGKTTLGVFNALLSRCCFYIGMDTLNTHLSAALNKPTVAIFGPTLVKRWSPWSRESQSGAEKEKGVQTYGNITLITPEDDCSGCGLAGCQDNNDSRCIALEKLSVSYVWDNVYKTMLEKNILN
ncbi:MAG: lipopolysaccharide heptosyltransferase [Candidatus Muiribacterium halophilum]|uniref:Lipopolysaccharide heptosyltransferase n=1 Tax=Muiribacterium halophilum TaxID=2053465 RepID=A0A2N5ZHD8_MUIH1|nr:MAG: lipopolysaccharide heptosyltransferase [Candidatus Muirbacterium halophilum]